MKKLFKNLIMAICALTMMTSCGSSKQSIASVNAEVEVSSSEAQKLAEEKPSIRDWGEATNFNQSFAKTYAEGQARAAFSRKLSSIIKSASRQTTDGAMQAHSDGDNASSGEDQGFLSDALVTQISQNTVKNTAVIKTNTFKRKDGQYHCYVCIEYRGKIADLASEIVGEAKKGIGQQISDQERAKMEVRMKDFEESVNKELAKYKN